MPVTGTGLNLFARNLIDDIDMAAFRENSLQLDEFMRGDFSSMKAELYKAFPNSPNMQERYIQFARRVAEEQSALYRKPPRRVWGGVTAAIGDKLDEIWANGRFDCILHEMQMRGVLQRTIIALVLPEHPRLYSLHHYAPHEAAVAPARGNRWRDIERADAVDLLWPIGTVDERVTHTVAHLTQTEAYVGEGSIRLPIYAGYNGNPFGRIPLHTLRFTEPVRGRFFASIAEDVLATNIQINLAESDSEALLHHQAWGQKVIETDGAESVPTQMMVDRLPVGSDRVMVLPVAGAKYRIVQGRPLVSEYNQQKENSMKTAAMMHDMSPARFSKANTAQTGAARVADMADRQEAREAYGKVFLACERWMLSHIGEISRVFGDPMPIPESARLEELQYHAWEPPADPQSAVQANQATDATGETSPVARVAMRFNVSRDAAVERMKRNLEEQGGLSPAPDPQPTQVVEAPDERANANAAA
jgi:hypothetical protein